MWKGSEDPSPGSPRKLKDAPGLCKTLSPLCVFAQRWSPPSISALEGPWSPLPCQAGTRLLAHPSRSPAGSGITRNLGSNPALLSPLPAGHRLASTGAANRLVKEVGEGCPERKINE